MVCLPSQAIAFFLLSIPLLCFSEKKKTCDKNERKKMHLHHVSGFVRFIALNLKLFTWLYYMQFCFLFFFLKVWCPFFSSSYFPTLLDAHTIKYFCASVHVPLLSHLDWVYTEKISSIKFWKFFLFDIE